MTRQQIIDAAKAAGFRGGNLTERDIANAQKFGTKIFGRTLQGMEQPQGGGFQYDPKLQLPFEEQVRQDYIKRDPQLAGLTQQQATARGQLFSRPFEAQQQYQNIFNPLERQKLISQSIGNVLGQLSGFSSLIESRRQKATDLAKNLSGYMEEQNAQKAAEAKAAQQKFENEIALAKLQLERGKAGRESATEKKAQQVADYNKDLANLAAFIQSEGPLQPGRLTREEAAQELARNYSFKDFAQIYQDIIKTFPSAVERENKLKEATIIFGS